MASCNSCTTSSFSTPSHLNPFVHRTSRPQASPSCLHGNENVKPRGNDVAVKPLSCIKLLIQFAMWSNNWKKKQEINILYTFCGVHEHVMCQWKKYVPQRMTSLCEDQWRHYTRSCQGQIPGEKANDLAVDLAVKHFIGQNNNRLSILFNVTL